MKARFAIAVLAIAVLLGVSLLVGGNSDSPDVATTSNRRPTPRRSLPAPRMTGRQINRQDRPDVRRQRTEAQAFDRRPLLNVLPTTLQSVRFEIGGLAADGWTTIIRANAGGLGRRRARIAYDTLIRRTGDRSRLYQLEIRP